MSNLKNIWAEYFLLILIIAIGLGFRLVNLSQPPEEWFPTRQAMDADIIRSFYRGETTFFRPVVHNFTRPGYLLQEFPLLWWLIGKTMWIFGGFSIAGARFGIVLFYPLLCLALYQFQKQFFSGIAMRLLPVAVITVLPLSIIQSRSIQPEFPIITILMWTLVFWVKHLKRRDAKYYLLTGLCLVLAVLMKPFDLYILAPMGITVVLLPQKDRFKFWKQLAVLSFLAMIIGYLWWSVFVPQIRSTTPSVFDIVWQPDFVSSMLKIHLSEIRFWRGLIDNFVVATATNIGAILVFGFVVISIKEIIFPKKKFNCYLLFIIAYGLGAVLMLVGMSINSLQEYYFTHLLPPTALAITYFVIWSIKKIFPLNKVFYRVLTVGTIVLIYLAGRKYYVAKFNVDVNKSSLLIDQVQSFVPKDDTVVVLSHINSVVHGFYLDRWNLNLTINHDFPRSKIEEQVNNYRETHGKKWIESVGQLNKFVSQGADYLLITDLRSFGQNKEFRDYILKEKKLVYSDEHGYLFRL